MLFSRSSHILDQSLFSGDYLAYHVIGLQHTILEVQTNPVSAHPQSLSEHRSSITMTKVRGIVIICVMMAVVSMLFSLGARSTTAAVAGQALSKGIIVLIAH